MLDMNQWLTDYQKAVLILDAVTVENLNCYKKNTDTLPYSELLCGEI